MLFSLDDFNISNWSKEKFGEIIILIISSVTIETKEQKQYWIDALETMTDNQLVNLKKILSDEHDELKKIDEQYEQKVQNAEAQAVTKIKQEEIRAKKQARVVAEQEEELTEKKLEADLLKQLEAIDN